MTTLPPITWTANITDKEVIVTAMYPTAKGGRWADCRMDRSLVGDSTINQTIELATKLVESDILLDLERQAR